MCCVIRDIVNVLECLSFNDGKHIVCDIVDSVYIMMHKKCAPVIFRCTEEGSKRTVNENAGSKLRSNTRTHTQPHLFITATSSVNHRYS